MSAVTTVRAVVFDVFGTLVDWRGSIVAAFRSFGRQREVTCDWEGLVDAWRAAYAPSMDRVRSGDLAWHNLDELHAASLDELAPRFGLPPLSADERAWIVHRWHELEPWPDVRQGLARLRTRIIVGTLSNGNVALQVDLMRYGGLQFDVLFSAEHFRHYKPDPQTYLGAAALLGLRPENVLLAAAHENDLHAAAALGLRTAFIARPLEFGVSERADSGLGGRYDFNVESVAQLADALDM